MLVLEGELLHVEKDGAFLVFSASEKNLLKQVESKTEANTMVFDRVYDRLAQGKTSTCANMFSRMGLPCEEERSALHGASSEWVEMVFKTNWGLLKHGTSYVERGSTISHK